VPRFVVDVVFFVVLSAGTFWFKQRTVHKRLPLY